MHRTYLNDVYRDKSDLWQSSFLDGFEFAKHKPITTPMPFYTGDRREGFMAGINHYYLTNVKYQLIGGVR